MANHVDSAQSIVPALTKEAFYASLRAGDLLFCSGTIAISRAIEGETHSPWSHVLMIWQPPWATQWLTLEATIQKGVHVGLLADYVDRYPGAIVLARRPALRFPDHLAAINKGLSLLDDGYDWQQEVTFAAHKLCGFFPIAKPRDDLYCSALQYVMSTATPYPLKAGFGCAATPEDNWTDSSVVAVARLLP